jgi:hypothetical protein
VVYLHQLDQLQQKNITDHSWTSNPTGLNTARTLLGGSGTQTAALGFGGATDYLNTRTAATEEYDGSTWTSS